MEQKVTVEKIIEVLPLLTKGRCKRLLSKIDTEILLKVLACKLFILPNYGLDTLNHKPKYIKDIVKSIEYEIDRTKFILLLTIFTKLESESNLDIIEEISKYAGEENDNTDSN